MIKRKKKDFIDNEEKYYLATQWQLMLRKFSKHKLAKVGLIILCLLYFVGIFAEFFAPYNMSRRDIGYLETPPSKLHWIDSDGNFSIIPFVYEYTLERNPETWKNEYVENTENKYHLRFFVKGDEYKLLGIIPGNIHFLGVESEGRYFVMGTDYAGRDLFSRIFHALRVSLFTGLVGVFFTFILGCVMGGISGYYGGVADTIIQRIIEFLLSMPAIPLWMGLAAAMPKDWSTLKVYFSITIILSLQGWCGLARVVRGKFLELRNEDYVTSAIVAGASDSYIIKTHLLPSFMSYLIVNLTLAIPAMILGETSLSFLGIGLRAPVVSLGVLLQDAQSISVIALTPWILLPGLFVVLIVLSFNFVGDGLRDAADPYK